MKDERPTSSAEHPTPNTKAMERPIADRMVRRESVERKRASTAAILGGRRLNPQNSPDYRHD